MPEVNAKQQGPGTEYADTPAAARDPEDRQLRAFVEFRKKRAGALSDKTIGDRARELLAGLRGDAGASSERTIAASPLAFGGGMVPRAKMSPAAVAAAAASMPGVDARFVSNLTRDAATKMQLGDLPAAEMLLSRRLEENPSDASALRLRALARRQMKNFNSSAEDARGALTLAPGDSRSRRLLIENLVDLGRSHEALEIADKALKADPRDAQALAGRAQVWASLGRPEQRLADLKEAALYDAQFDGLARAAENEGTPRPRSGERPRPGIVRLGAFAIALLLFATTLLPKLRAGVSTSSEIRLADRVDSVPSGYTLGPRLGQGGMGVVYEGEDRALKRKVAIKILRPEVADNPRERRRFLKEARTVAKLKHQNIVDIHSVHDENGEVWLVFEHIQGETLHEALGRGRLPAPKALSLFGQIASALDYAHGQGVVHQDLKPGNIMTAGDIAKVMDFGIARCVRETMSTVSRLEVSGTPAYMAPEQELGGASVGPAADIFAFGACAYECLSGQLPFPGGHVMIKMEKRYRLLSEFVGLPTAVDPVLARALEPEPTKRWPTAAAFVAALTQALAPTQA